MSENRATMEIEQNEKPDTRWVMRIKELSRNSGCSISEAQHIILSNPLWRRWAVSRANQNARCAKEARLYIRDLGGAAFLAKYADQFVTRQKIL